MNDFILLTFVFTISAVVGSFCWPFTINSWLSFVGKDSQIVWWQGALIGLAIPAVIVALVLILV